MNGVPVLSLWWVWIAAGLVLGILEVLLPSWIFLGFAVGAVAVGLLLALGILGAVPVWTLVVFAALSLAAYVALRLVLGSSGRGEVRVIRRDINEN